MSTLEIKYPKMERHPISRLMRLAEAFHGACAICLDRMGDPDERDPDWCDAVSGLTALHDLLGELLDQARHE